MCTAIGKAQQIAKTQENNAVMVIISGCFGLSNFAFIAYIYLMIIEKYIYFFLSSIVLFLLLAPVFQKFELME